MKPTQATANPLLLALLGCWLVAEALATFLISLAALVLTIAGWIVLAEHRLRTAGNAPFVPSPATPPMHLFTPEVRPSEQVPP